MKKRENIFYLFYTLTFLSLFYGFCIQSYRTIFISVLTILLFLIVDFFEKVFLFKFSFFLKFIIFSFIFSAQILGEVFNFYIIFSFWDNLLHFFSGLIVASFGFSLVYDFFIKSRKFKKYFFINFLFMFSFSVSVAVFWEFTEFAFDKYFGFDMQKDTVINNFNSVSLNDNGLIISRVNNIKKTLIYVEDSVIVLENGYLDIGLIDTMNDLFFSTISACLFCFFSSFYIVFDKFNFMEKFRIIKK